VDRAVSSLEQRNTTDRDVRQLCEQMHHHAPRGGASYHTRLTVCRLVRVVLGNWQFNLLLQSRVVPSTDQPDGLDRRVACRWIERYLVWSNETRQTEMWGNCVNRCITTPREEGHHTTRGWECVVWFVLYWVIDISTCYCSRAWYRRRTNSTASTDEPHAGGSSEEFYLEQRNTTDRDVELFDQLQLPGHFDQLQQPDLFDQL